MNLDTITKTNTKGQIVIPKRFREELGINKNILLNVSFRGNGIYITVLNNTLATSDSNLLALEVLKKTAGAWGSIQGDKKIEKIHKLELKRSSERKKLW